MVLRLSSATWARTLQKVRDTVPLIYVTFADLCSEFAMLHDDEVIPKYAADICIGRVKGQEITLEY